MNKFKMDRDILHHWRKAGRLLLALFWCAGLFMGMYVAPHTDDVFYSLMRSAVSGRVSIVGLLSVYLLPFLLTVLTVYLSKSWLILPIAFLKSFSYGICQQLVALIYGEPGWLFRMLFLFSDSCLLVVMCWFWFRHITGSCPTVKRDAAICIVVFAVIGAIDYHCISPFLTMLINN